MYQRFKGLWLQCPNINYEFKCYNKIRIHSNRKTLSLTLSLFNTWYLILYSLSMIDLTGQIFADSFSIVPVNWYRTPWQPNLSWAYDSPLCTEVQLEQGPIWLVKLKLGLKKKMVFIHLREIESMTWGLGGWEGGEAEGETYFMLHRDPEAGLYPRTPRPWLEPKADSTKWATQAPPKLGFLMLDINA